MESTISKHIEQFLHPGNALLGNALLYVGIDSGMLGKGP